MGNTNAVKYNFLIKKSSSPQMALSYWLQVPEFIAALADLEAQNITIDDASVFPIMQKIYLEKEQNGADFNYYLARKALRKIAEALFGNADMWNKTS